jgi:hypothetical protein
MKHSEKKAFFDKEAADLDRVGKELFGGKERLIDPFIQIDLSVLQNDIGFPGDPTSDADPSVTREQLDEALLTHCRTSRDQLGEIEKKGD